MKFFRVAFLFLLPVLIQPCLQGAYCKKKCTQKQPSAPGPSGMSHLYTFNNFSSSLMLIPGGDFVPFVGPIKGAGGSIFKDSEDPTLFTITQEGNYLVHVVGHVLLGNQGGICLIVNGNPTDNPGVPPTFDSSPIVHQEVIAVNQVPATLRIQVTGTSLDFHPGASASIVITQLSFTSANKKK